MLVSVDEILTPKTVKHIEKEGMPVLNKDSKDDEEVTKGDLYVTFDIRFPKTLNDSQRKRIEASLKSEE